jgi:hypothetical protein
MTEITGKAKAVARGLYNRTRTENRLPFSVNDFRDFEYHKLSRFRNRQEIGGFFQALQREGYIVAVGEVKAEHPEARGRMVNLWMWLDKAHKTFRRNY